MTTEMRFKKIIAKWIDTPKVIPTVANANGNETIPPPIIFAIKAKAAALFVSLSSCIGSSISTLNDTLWDSLVSIVCMWLLGLDDVIPFYECIF